VVSAVSKPKRNERRVKIPEVSKADTAKRFHNLLSESLKCKKVEDKGQYVVTHHRIHTTGGQDVEVILYTNDTVFVSSSPRMARSEFEALADKVVGLAEISKTSVSELRPVTVLRAKSLLDYASSLDFEDENQRMVAVIICDTSNEIMLTELMKTLGITGPPLDEGIPEKIQSIKGKGRPVHKEDEIRNIRELRNAIVHRGQIPDMSQAKKCLEICAGAFQQICA